MGPSAGSSSAGVSHEILRIRLPGDGLGQEDGGTARYLAQGSTQWRHPALETDSCSDSYWSRSGGPPTERTAMLASSISPDSDLDNATTAFVPFENVT